jgi:hypothetical protein
MAKFMLVFVHILLLVLLPSLLPAKDNLLGLDFGLAFSRASKVLIDNGFTPDQPDSLNFTNRDGSCVRLFLGIEEKLLLSWMICLPVPEQEDFEEQALSTLVSFHGDDYDYDWDYSEAWWKLDEFHYVNAGFNEDRSIYIIFYGDTREEELSPY